MNFVLHGHAGVGGGITVGYAHLVSTARLEVAHYEVAARRGRGRGRALRRARSQAAQEELAELKAHIAGRRAGRVRAPSSTCTA